MPKPTISDVTPDLITQNATLTPRAARKTIQIVLDRDDAIRFQMFAEMHGFSASELARRAVAPYWLRTPSVELTLAA